MAMELLTSCLQPLFSLFVSMKEEKLAVTEVEGDRSELAVRPASGDTAAPSLVFPHEKGIKDHTFNNFSEPNNNQIHLKSTPELIHSSHQGWVIIICDQKGDCYLRNPVSLERIQLPNISEWMNKYFPCSYQYVLSSPPSRPDSMVIFLFTQDQGEINRYFVVYCRPGDKEWREQELSQYEEYSPRALFCYKSKVYVDCVNAHLEIGKLRHENDRKTLPISWFEVCDEHLSCAVGALPHYKTHFVESLDELFKVHKIYCGGNGERQVMALQVLRMNFSLMAWEEVKTLGDHVLFLEGSTASCSAVQLGLARGCLYFTQPRDRNRYIYDLEDDTVIPFLPCPYLPQPGFKLDWLTIPTSVRANVDGRKRTDMIGKGKKKDINIEEEKNKTHISDEVKEESPKNIGRELEGVGTLAILIDNNILELIASFLHPVDFMHFRAVSKAIRSVIPIVNWRTSSIEISQTTSVSPWLVSYKTTEPTYNFVDPMHSTEKYLMDLSEFVLDATIRFSKGSWLLMTTGYKTIFFFNPFTRRMIQLPDLPDEHDYIFSGISFSSSPTSSDCVVFAIVDWGDDTVLIYVISRGNDSWTWFILNNTMTPYKGKRVRFRPQINSVVFCNTAFYCLDSNGILGVFDGFSWKVLTKLRRPCTSLYQCFLVECEGKLLSVFVGHMGKWVRIFRLDFSKMVWVEVESLGKHMLFISNISCLSAVAPDTRMKNKIYFPRFHSGGIMFYSLDTGRFHFVGNQHSTQDFYYIKEQLNCCWVEPYWSQVTDREFDWLSLR